MTQREKDDTTYDFYYSPKLQVKLKRLAKEGQGDFAEHFADINGKEEIYNECTDIGAAPCMSKYPDLRYVGRGKQVRTKVRISNPSFWQGHPLELRARAEKYFEEITTPDDEWDEILEF